MKLNRRKAMGVALGGAVAGPSMITSAIKNSPNKLNLGPKASYGEATQSMDAGESLIDKANSIKRRIETVTKLANGDFSDTWTKSKLESKAKEFMEHLFENNVDCLKSTSNSYKLYMLQDRFIANMKKEWIENAKAELKSLLGMKL